MPSVRHESLLALFRNRPALAAELLEQGLRLALPAHDDLRLESAALTEVTPVAYRADLVVQLWRQGKLVLGIVVEVQLGPDPDKRFTWPLYVASLRAKLECPCWLLVLSPDAAVARWCAEPIELGHPGHTLTPLVLGPDAVPVLANAEQARAAPELAVLSAMAHGGGPDGRDVVLAALDAAFNLDEERSRFYYDLVMGSLADAARRAMEDLMSTGNHQYQTEFARRYVAQGKAEGEAKGKAEAILAVLQARGIATPEAIRARILSCSDVATLDAWIARAATAISATEVVAEG